MKIKIILLIIGVIFLFGYVVYLNYFNGAEKINSFVEDKKEEVKTWYPETLQDCKKQKAILLDAIKNLDNR